MLSKRTFIILLISIIAITIIGVVMYFGTMVTYEIKNIKVGDKLIK